MVNGPTDRRTILKISSAVGLSGIAGCVGTAWLDRVSGGGTTHSSDRWNSQRYLPNAFFEGLNAFFVTSPSAVVRDRELLGPDISSNILQGTLGEEGWISNDEIERHLNWQADGWGFAFKTDLSREEIISRYDESQTRSRRIGSYKEYILFDRSGALHAVTDNVVLNLSTLRKPVITSYIDSLGPKRSSNPKVREALSVLDSTYSLSVYLVPSRMPPFKDSGVSYRGYCHAVTPYPEEPGFTLTTAIMTDTPEALAKWAATQGEITFIERIHREPTIRTTDKLVLLEETGTVESFDVYR